jgi:hypothetical protein
MRAYCVVPGNTLIETWNVCASLRLGTKKLSSPYLTVHFDVTVGEWGAAFRFGTNAPEAVPLPANHSRGLQRNEFAARGRLAHAPGAVALPIGLHGGPC